MTKTCAIVVTYNRKEKLARCLEALWRSSLGTDILVVDNASTDGTGEMVKEFEAGGKLAYCNTGKNLGGAGGFQFGIRTAVERGYEYLWIMDDDCIPENDALAQLVIHAERLGNKFGFLSSLALWSDGSLCNMNIQKTGLKKKVEDLDSPEVNVITASFVSLFFRRETVLEMGLPIKEFFIWADDLEYTRRISRKYPCYLIPSSRVLHEMESNDKVNIATDSCDRLWRYAYLYRNEVYVYRREGFSGWVYLYTRLALHLVRILLKGTGGKGKKFATVWKSFFSGMKFRPEIEFVEPRK